MLLCILYKEKLFILNMRNSERLFSVWKSSTVLRVSRLRVYKTFFSSLYNLPLNHIGRAIALLFINKTQKSYAICISPILPLKCRVQISCCVDLDFNCVVLYFIRDPHNIAKILRKQVGSSIIWEKSWRAANKMFINFQLFLIDSLYDFHLFDRAIPFIFKSKKRLSA